MTRLWSTGRIQRRRMSPRANRSSSVIGAPSASSGAATIVNRMCWAMWTLNSVVSYRSIADASAISMTRIPATNAATRLRGTGFPGCASSTWRTAHR